MSITSENKWDLITSLRFVTWNWNCFSDNRNDRKAELLYLLSPDVIALQEVEEASLAALKIRFPDWTVVTPLEWGTTAWPKDDRGHELPGVALLIAPGIQSEEFKAPSLDSWITTEGLKANFQRKDDAFPEARAFVGATLHFNGEKVTVISAHPPHASSSDPDVRLWRVLRKRRTYEVLRQWISKVHPLIIGMDTNAWVDTNQPFEPYISNAVEPQNDIMLFVRDGDVKDGGSSHGHLDAFRLWLKENHAEWNEIQKRRPFGPLATTYNRSMNHPRPERFGLVMVSPNIRVTSIDHGYEDSLAAGSDHGYVLCELELD